MFLSSYQKGAIVRGKAIIRGNTVLYTEGFRASETQAKIIKIYNLFLQKTFCLMQGLIFSDKCVNRKTSFITNHSRAGSMCFTLETDTIAIKKEKNRNSRIFCEQKIY